MAVYTVFLLLTPIVAGLDGGRFRWSTVPGPAKLLAWLGLLLAGALIFWALAANTYLSRMARIQEDRGQVVVAAGSYRFVRHPLYSGIIRKIGCCETSFQVMLSLPRVSDIGLCLVSGEKQGSDTMVKR